MWVTLMIYFLGILAIFSGIMMIVYKNPLHSALWFGLVLFSLAGIFALLQAHFLALIQILVYVGAITVLIVYVIALLNFDQKDLMDKLTILKGIGLLTAMVLFVELLFYISAKFSVKVLPTPQFGKAATVGMTTFTTYLLPFEVVSVLLLVAVVGGIYIAKKD